MKNGNKKNWKFLSFGTTAVMLAHLIILQFSMTRYSAFTGATWYQDSNKLFLLGLYGVPIIIVTALRAAFFFAKHASNEKLYCFIKFGVVLAVDFFVFFYMLLFYHNPTAEEFYLLAITCSAVAITGVLIMAFEINTKHMGRTKEGRSQV